MTRRLVLAACALPLLMSAPTAALTRKPTATPTLPPRLELRASPDPARTGQEVTLTASRRIAFSTPRWTQIDGPSVPLTGADTLQATFIAPVVAARTTLAFRFGLPSEPDSTTVEVAIVPADAVSVTIEGRGGAPGGLAPVAIRIDPVGFALARFDHSFGFAPEAAVASREDDTPDCYVIDGTTATFDFLPAGCDATTPCTAVHAALQFAAPLTAADVAYRCRVALTAEEADTCTHALTCVDGSAQTDTGDTLQVACRDGEVTSMFATPNTQFTLQVEPEVPQVGDLVRFTFSVDQIGGIPRYILGTGWPFFADGGAEPTETGPGRVVFERRARIAGNATVFLSVDSEINGGCPGAQFFYFYNAISPAFAVLIEDPNGAAVTGRVAEIPGCQGAMRGVDVVLEPGHRVTRTDLSTGLFSFAGVSPGSYSLTVPTGCNPFGCWGARDITVGERNVAVTLCPLSPACVGDCNGDRRVAIDELVAGVALALEGSAAPCAALDSDGSGAVQIAELVTAVSTALNGCTGFNNVTPSPTPTPTPPP